jgi:hypothetical protein
VGIVKGIVDNALNVVVSVSGTGGAGPLSVAF